MIQTQTGMVKLNKIWRKLLVVTSDTPLEFGDTYTVVQEVDDNTLTRIYTVEEVHKVIQKDGVYKHWVLYSGCVNVFESDAIEALEVLGYTEVENG